MEKWRFILPLVFSYFLASAMDQTLGSYQACLSQSNKLSDPYSRDTRKVFCFDRFTKIQTPQSCKKLAAILEYTSISDQLLAKCVDQLGNDVTSCIDLSVSMNYGDNADQALWSCMQKIKLPRYKEQCFKISKHMRLPHNRARSLEICKNSP